MKQFKKRQIGFTVAELFIFVLVVGLIFVLALLSLQAVKAKSRDTVRRNAIDGIAAQLESCYSGKKCNGTYPSLLQLTDTAAGGFVGTNLPSLNTGYLYDSSAGIVQAGSPSAATQYQYSVTPNGCSGTTGSTPCTGFTLKTYQETNPNNPYVKESLHK